MVQFADRQNSMVTQADNLIPKHNMCLSSLRMHVYKTCIHLAQSKHARLQEDVDAGHMLTNNICIIHVPWLSSIGRVHPVYWILQTISLVDVLQHRSALHDALQLSIIYIIMYSQGQPQNMLSSLPQHLADGLRRKVGALYF